MDPISSINVKKDSSFAMLLEAQRRGYSIHYMEMNDLYIEDNRAKANSRTIELYDNPQQWYAFNDKSQQPVELSELDVILMRKDPPFNMEYIYATYILELAEQTGTLIVNHPRALRDANEKLFTFSFPDCIVPTLVSRNPEQFKTFLKQYQDIIVKPLGGMGGHSIFRLKEHDPNLNVILETVTQHASRYIMAQRFIPEISKGDKRILLIDGEPVDYALARIPEAGETRGNLAAGGSGVGIPLSERDRWLCSRVGPVLKDKGLLFVGMDVIGDYITEINVTSPTCIRELDALYQLNISAVLMDTIEAKCKPSA